MKYYYNIRAIFSFKILSNLIYSCDDEAAFSVILQLLHKSF